MYVCVCVRAWLYVDDNEHSRRPVKKYDIHERTVRTLRRSCLCNQTTLDKCLLRHSTEIFGSTEHFRLQTAVLWMKKLCDVERHIMQCSERYWCAVCAVTLILLL
jgi:hypothetical protein